MRGRSASCWRSSLPTGFGEAWLGAFAQGLAEDAAHYGIPLYGGDTDHTPGPISVSIFAFGAVPQGRMVHRSTARPGDCIVVTGTIGDAAIGLQLRRDRALARRWRLSDAAAAWLEGRYLLPQPRNALADAVLQYASAAIDVSDGLAGDLAKLCRASSVAADIDIARVPLSEAAHAAIAAEPALLETALTGGDDYEIVLTVAPEKAHSLPRGRGGGRRRSRPRSAAFRPARAHASCGTASRSPSRARPTAIFSIA